MGILPFLIILALVAIWLVVSQVPRWRTALDIFKLKTALPATVSPAEITSVDRRLEMLTNPLDRHFAPPGVGAIPRESLVVVYALKALKALDYLQILLVVLTAPVFGRDPRDSLIRRGAAFNAQPALVFVT